MFQKESPEYVKLSLAAAMQLGFHPGRFYRNAKMTCINLLLTYSSGCYANCSYCGLAREREIDENNRSFIRVPWPVKSMDEIIGKINLSKIVKRVCISMITNKRSIEDTVYLTKRLSTETEIPVSVLIAPTIVKKEHLMDMKESGADKIGVAFDLPNEELFERHRGKGVEGPHKWQRYWEVFSECVEVFGEKMVGSHFIVGLSETEKEMVEAFQKVSDLGGVNHLFSFYPEKGSTLSELDLPPMDNYRRIQIACELIDSGLSKADKFEYDENGKIIDFGISENDLECLINSGKPFETRGCLGEDGKVACNRPFANSLPGENMRNYPFTPNEEDIARIKTQLGE